MGEPERLDGTGGASGRTDKPAQSKYEAKEQIPAGQPPFYIEREGAFCLEAEGLVDKSKLDEFRANNVALKKQVEELTQRFEGIDTDGVVERVTVIRSLTFFDSKSELAKLSSGQTAKSQKDPIGSLTQVASRPNAVYLVESVRGAAGPWGVGVAAGVAAGGGGRRTRGGAVGGGSDRGHPRRAGKFDAG